MFFDLDMGNRLCKLREHWRLQTNQFFARFTCNVRTWKQGILPVAERADPAVLRSQESDRGRVTKGHRGLLSSGYGKVRGGGSNPWRPRTAGGLR